MPIDDKWYLTPPESKVFCECEYCGEDIYVGEEVFDIESEVIHVDCFIDWCVKNFEPETFIAGE